MNVTELKICQYCHKQAEPMGMNPRGKHICGPCILSNIEAIECWHCDEFKTGVAIEPNVDQICSECMLKGVDFK